MNNSFYKIKCDISSFVIFTLFTLVFCLLQNASAAQIESSVKTITITDMAGHKVKIPGKINSVYSTSPMGEVIMYTLAPSKIAGKTWILDNDETSFLTDEYLKKPVLGGWFGKNTTGNPEVIIKANPDIVLSMGYLNNTDISSALRIEEKLGIPTLMVDAKLSTLDSSYRFLGKLLGVSERADTLARYFRSAFDYVSTIASKIPDDKKVKIYYAEGINGLETDPSGSMHTELIDLIGAINVAKVPGLNGYGRATVSFEQLLVWKPQIVLVCLDHGYAHGTENYNRITTSPSWKSIDAVKNNRVYLIPSLPFNCLDRPPSVNRIFGLYWLSNLIYPDYFRIDIKKETKNFYKLFYHLDLKDSELDYVLKNSTKQSKIKTVE